MTSAQLLGIALAAVAALLNTLAMYLLKLTWGELLLLRQDMRKVEQLTAQHEVRLDHLDHLEHGS